jgi:nucleoside-diphosphate-sugar epimerase
MTPKDKILVIGALGQIGQALTTALRAKYGNNQVIATDLRQPDHGSNGPFEVLNVLDRQALFHLIVDKQVSVVYNLAAILSAKGEQDPIQAWEINMNGLLNTLEAGRELKLKRIFWPSSIAVFGKNTPRELTPQLTVTDPETIYGISKLAGERWCAYYHQRYGLDVRSLRYPGLISYEALPGGGTTDYAVAIFHEAIKHAAYTCYLRHDTPLPMMYMPDAIRATLELMEAPASAIRYRDSYNLQGMTFTPEELATAIRVHIPQLEMTYSPDFRQAIADSWPSNIDDQASRSDWGWKPAYGLAEMAAEMITQLRLAAVAPELRT